MYIWIPEAPAAVYMHISLSIYNLSASAPYIIVIICNYIIVMLYIVNYHGKYYCILSLYIIAIYYYCNYIMVMES